MSNNKWFTNYVLGGVAGMGLLITFALFQSFDRYFQTKGACCISNPFEVAKVRMQVHHAQIPFLFYKLDPLYFFWNKLQGELMKGMKKKYKNVFHCLFTTFKNEGFKGVQKGLPVSLVHQFTMNGLRLGSFSFLQGYFGDVKEKQSRKFGKNLLFGFASGFISSGVASPFQLVKTRMQR